MKWLLGKGWLGLGSVLGLLLRVKSMYGHSEAQPLFRLKVSRILISIVHGHPATSSHQPVGLIVARYIVRLFLQRTCHSCTLYLYITSSLLQLQYIVRHVYKTLTKRTTPTPFNITGKRAENTQFIVLYNNR